MSSKVCRRLEGRHDNRQISRVYFHASLTGRIGTGWYHRNPDSDSSLDCDNGQPRSPIFGLGGK